MQSNLEVACSEVALTAMAVQVPTAVTGYWLLSPFYNASLSTNIFCIRIKAPVLGTKVKDCFGCVPKQMLPRTKM